MPVLQPFYSFSPKATRYDNIEDAQCAIRSYRGGKPKTEEKFQNWCKCSMRINSEIIPELWIWYSQQNRETDSGMTDHPANQYGSIDEAKLGLR